MENKKLSELSNEELLKRKKTIRLVTGILIGGIGTLVILNLVNIINGKQNWSIISVPVALLPIVFIISKSLKEIEKEFKSRNIS